MKKIYDPIHGFIRFDDIEGELIDSLPFQRLHWIHQLSTAHLVYPGATHKRFEHSLGTMAVATEIYDRLTESAEKYRPGYFPRKGGSEWDFWRKMVRMASLCHDLGHLPFSHGAEKTLLKELTHEDYSVKLIKSDFLKPVWQKLGDANAIAETVVKLAVGPFHCSYKYTPLERALTEIITGDFFGADRIDYLLRDGRASGLAYGSFDYHQLIEMMRIFPSEERLELGVDIHGIESCEALLLARYFMHKRIYQYPSVKAYAFHLSAFMKGFYAALPLKLTEFILFTDSHVERDIYETALCAHHPLKQHAEPFLNRKKRYSALSTEQELSEDGAERIRLKLGVPEENFGYELASKRRSNPFSFPVQCGPSKVCIASEVSTIAIPFNQANWLFLPRDYLNGSRIDFTL